MYKINTCGVQNAATIAAYHQDRGKQGATLLRATHERLILSSKLGLGLAGLTVTLSMRGGNGQREWFWEVG